MIWCLHDLRGFFIEIIAEHERGISKVPIAIRIRQTNIHINAQWGSRCSVCISKHAMVPLDD